MSKSGKADTVSTALYPISARPQAGDCMASSGTTQLWPGFVCTRQHVLGETADRGHRIPNWNIGPRNCVDLAQAGLCRPRGRRAQETEPGRTAGRPRQLPPCPSHDHRDSSRVRVSRTVSTVTLTVSCPSPHIPYRSNRSFSYSY